jgi:hypothetical protein
MPSHGQTEVDFNSGFFDNIMKSAGVENLVKEKAEAALSIARHTAPVDSGDYKKHLALERYSSKYRFAWRVIGRDWKTLLIEAKTGNLARAIKAVKGL